MCVCVSQCTISQHFKMSCYMKPNKMSFAYLKLALIILPYLESVIQGRFSQIIWYNVSYMCRRTILLLSHSIFLFTYSYLLMTIHLYYVVAMIVVIFPPIVFVTIPTNVNIDNMAHFFIIQTNIVFV